MLENLLHNRGVVLILTGGILLLASSGTITSPYGGYEPLPGNQAIRFVFVSVAGLLILSGLAVALKEQGIHNQALGWVHLVLSAMLLVGFGTWISFTFRGESLATAEPAFLRWEASADDFYAELETTQLERYADTHNALLFCRINDPSVPIEEEERIVTSALYPIKGKDRLPIRINFDTGFREGLAPNDHVECHLALLPIKYQKSEVKSLRQLREELDGVLPGSSVSDRVSDCPVRPAEPDQDDEDSS